jgi:hypothetical protein
LRQPPPTGLIVGGATLRLMARALAEEVKRLPKLDWTRRESVRLIYADVRESCQRRQDRWGQAPSRAWRHDARKVLDATLPSNGLVRGAARLA